MQNHNIDQKGIQIPQNEKSGWPWTDETQIMPETMPDGSPWPRISIVTPSFNQGQFLDETIRSVLSQGYPNLEYLIIDGGSTDNSIEIIKNYEPWLAYWVSEPDRGQSHAINKGFSRSSGEIMAWINSDDYYLPGAFVQVALTFKENNTQWCAGECKFLLANGGEKNGWGKPVPEIERWFVGPMVMQPGVFWKREIWDHSNKIDDTMEYSFDYDLWFQFVKHQPFPYWIDDLIAVFRIHDKSKTYNYLDRFRQEDKVIHNRYQFLIPKADQKFKVWVLKKEHRANKLIGRAIGGNKFLNFLVYLKVLAITPWYLFRRSLYTRFKVMIRKEN